MTDHEFHHNIIKGFTVISIQSRFDTSRFDTNQSRFDTNQKSFRYKSKVVSIQIESLKFNVKPRENASCVCYCVFN